MTPGLPLLLLALALRRAQGNAGTSPGPPPVPPELSCGAEVLEAVLGRLRALEGEVRALQGQCGDSLGPQAGTGMGAGRGEMGTWRVWGSGIRGMCWGEWEIWEDFGDMRCMGLFEGCGGTVGTRGTR